MVNTHYESESDNLWLTLFLYTDYTCLYTWFFIGIVPYFACVLIEFIPVCMEIRMYTNRNSRSPELRILMDIYHFKTTISFAGV